MSYIGRKPTIGNFQICDAISVVNGQAAYTMQVGSVNVIPQSANHMIVSLNGTIQKPNSSYTVSGSTITFSSNLATGDVIDFIQILGDVLDLGVPSDATVTTAKLGANSVTAAKLADSSVTTAKLNDSAVTTAKLNDASVSLAKLTATGTKDATTFLRGDNTFAEASSGGLIKLTTTTLGSNASAIDFDDTYITSTYTNYYIIGHILPATDNTYLNFQVMTGGSVQSGSSDYGSSAASTGSSNYLTDNDHAQMVLTHTSGGNASGEGVSFFMNLYNPLSTAFSTSVNGICTFENTSGNEEGSIYSGQKRSVEANNGIRFLMNIGDIASGSYVTLYGIKN